MLQSSVRTRTGKIARVSQNGEARGAPLALGPSMRMDPGGDCGVSF